MSGFLSDPRNRIVFNDLKDDLFSKQKPIEPVAIIYGGQPGSGKAAIKSFLFNEHQDLAILDGDEFRKEHPDYKAIAKSDPDNMPRLTQQFVYGLLGALKDYAHENKKSYALETTFHDGPKTHETFKEAQRNGFMTELHVLAVHPRISYLSTFKRFESGKLGSIGRKVTKEDHFDRAGKM